MRPKLNWISAYRHFLDYSKQLLHFRLRGVGHYEEVSFQGKVCIVTGSNTGIGKQVALELSQRGAIVILACRNLRAGREAMEEIKGKIATSGQNVGRVEVMELDLGDLESVRRFAMKFQEKYSELHLLVNNAGICSYEKVLQKNKQGFELHMGVNHLGHFLLTNLLLDNLKAGSPCSRIVTLTSTSLLYSQLNLEDLMMDKADKPTMATGITRMPYNNSKFANALFTKELGRRLEGSGVLAVALCPGIVKTDMFRDYHGFDKAIAKGTVAFGGISVKQSATGVIFCALSKSILELGNDGQGRVYRFGQEFKAANSLLTSSDASELWEISERLVGINHHYDTKM